VAPRVDKDIHGLFSELSWPRRTIDTLDAIGTFTVEFSAWFRRWFQILVSFLKTVENG
jgi:hypothetical protein